MKHLIKLRKLQPRNNINDIHKYLCDFKDKNLIRISSLITNLYELAESERELTERKKHGIDDKIFPKNANWERSFFVNTNPQNPQNSKIEHEYFLNLLYSLSFSMYLSKQNHKKFLNNNHHHLFKLEYFLNTLENLYVALDTLAVLICLICGLTKDIKQIYFSTLKNDLRESVYTKNFDINKFNINRSPINMLNRMRNMRAHRPFLDWNNEGKIVSDPKNLSKVKSICDKKNSFNKKINEFIGESFEETTTILIVSLNGILTTYKERLENDKAFQSVHKNWENFLS